jgi:hypothetical protein
MPDFEIGRRVPASMSVNYFSSWMSAFDHDHATSCYANQKFLCTSERAQLLISSGKPDKSLSIYLPDVRISM